MPAGSEVIIGGEGFDTANGVAVDIFCACAGGKVGPLFINPGDPRLTATSITMVLPAAGADALPVGPAAFVVSNRGADGTYSRKSNAVSVPIGQRLHVMAVSQSGKSLTVDGTGFSTLTMINFYTVKAGAVLNVGGFDAKGLPAIPITVVSDTRIRFAIPAGAVPGPAYVQAINPPFIPFTTSNDAGGAFILLDASAVPPPAGTPIATPTPASGSPTPAAPTPTPKASGVPTVTPTPAHEYAMLLTGGIDNNVTAAGVHPPLASAELYDEDSGAFSTTAPMAYARAGHSATVLNNGTILIAGGHNAWSVRAMPSAELYNVRTATFSLTGSMNSARLNHVAVALRNGKVLVAGGENVDFSAVDLAEIYDPATEQFTPTASMLAARTAAASAVLKDGSVLIAGGADNNGLLASAELYDAAGAGSVAVGPMKAARQGATATVLPNGNVLIAGGISQTAACDACATHSAEIFNPSTKTFAPTGNMHAARRGHSATLLANGTVLIAGGQDDTGASLASAEIYNPAAGTFSAAGEMNVARAQHDAALLENGKVLIAGGFTAPDTITASAEIFDPANGSFTAAASMNGARAAYRMGCFSPATDGVDPSGAHTSGRVVNPAGVRVR